MLRSVSILPKHCNIRYVFDTTVIMIIAYTSSIEHNYVSIELVLKVEDEIREQKL